MSFVCRASLKSQRQGGGFALPVLACLFVLAISHSALAEQDTDVSGRPSNDSSRVDAKPSRSGIVPPRLLHFEPAPYPSEAERLGIEGVVTLQISIDPEGHVTQVEVRDGAGHGFDEAAFEAAQRFVFEPAMRNEIPVAAKILYRYRFKLEPKAPPEPEKPAAPRLGELRGKVVAGTPPAPLVGVSLRVRASGADPIAVTTSSDGTWSIPDLAPGDYVIEVTATGYRQVVQREHVDEGRATMVTYGLESSDAMPLEVTVRGAALHREVAHYEITRTELLRVPGTMGDAIHAVETMPGVARPPAFNGVLLIRGSDPKDSSVYIEGTAVSRIYHFGSLSSVIPGEMVERIEFYPSNFSVRYGRGMGGVVEIRLRQTNPDDKVHASAQIDLINTRANVEGPIPKMRNWSFMAGVRTSYFDRWLVPVLRSSGSGISKVPRYYDYQLYVERRLPGNGVYRVGFFGAHDTYAQIEQTPGKGSHTESFGHLQSMLRLPLSSEIDFRANWSLGRNSVTQVEDAEDGGRSTTNVYNLAALRSEISLKTGRIGIARVGTDLTYSPFTIKLLRDERSSGGELAGESIQAPELVRYNLNGVFLRPAAYVEYELAPSRRVNVTAGTRADYTKDTSQTDIAPRISTRYVVVDGPLKTVLKGGAGLFYQPPDPTLTLPQVGTPGLTSSRAVHSMLGFEQSLSQHVTFSVEGFEKELRSLVVTHVNGSGEEVTENSGRGRVLGTDLLLRYHSDERFFGWLGYTLSRATRKPAPDKPEELFRYDQTHLLNVLASYRLGRGWEIGGRFRYASGLLYDACPGGLFNNSTGRYSCYGTQSQKRLAPFHQLDLRVEKLWEFNTYRISAYLDLINAYFHSSPDEAVSKYDLSGVSSQSLSLPLIPSFGVRGEL